MVDLRPVDYLSGLGGLQNLPNPAQEKSIAQGLRTTELQQQAAQLQIEQQRQKQERAQLFQQDIMGLGNDPNPLNIAAMIRKYPEFAEELKSSHEIQDEAKRNSDFAVQAQVYSAAATGKYDLAAQQLQSFVDAEVAAGQPADPADVAIITALKSGDPAEQKRALSMIGLSVAALNPKKFSETYEALGIGGDKKGQVVGRAIGHYGPDGKWVVDYRDPEPPVYREVGDGQSIVELPGSTSGGTPSGASPTAALSTRLNNPGAIRFDPANNWQGQVGQEDGFVKFDSVASGRRAHQKLIANQIKAGFDTPLEWAQRYAPASDGNDPNAYAQTVAKGLGIGVNDKIPLSAVPKVAAISAQVEAGGTPAPSGSARVVAQGPPKQAAAPSGYRWNDAGGLEPIPGGPADPAGAGNRNTTSNRKAEADFRKEFNNLPEVKNFRVVRGQLQQIEQIANKPNAQNDIAMIFSYMKMLDPTSVVREGEFATAQQAAGVPDRILNMYNRAVDGERLNERQRRDMVNSARSLYVSQRNVYNQRADEYRGYATDNGVDPDRVAPKYISPVDRARAAQSGGFKIIAVRPK